MLIFHIRQDTRHKKGTPVTIEGTDLASIEIISALMVGDVDIFESTDGFGGIEEDFNEDRNTQGYTAGKKIIGGSVSETFFLQDVKEDKGLVELHDVKDKLHCGFDIDESATYLNCLTDRSSK